MYFDSIFLNHEQDKELKINLLDYGVDAIELFSNGGGTVELVNSDELFNIINSTDKSIILVLTSKLPNVNMQVEVSTTKAGYSDGYDQLSASTTLSHNGINNLYLIIKGASCTLLVRPVE